MEHTDTERLDFLLKYFEIDDVGDEFWVPGICIRSESLEQDLSWNPVPDDKGQPQSHICGWQDDLRDVIDRAIEANS
jgi:hypothetical protein